MEVQDSTGAGLIAINNSGKLHIGRIDGGSPAFVAYLVINGPADQKQLTVRGHTTQTANLQEWQNSAGTALSYVNRAGSLVASNDPAVPNTNVIVAIAGDAATRPLVAKGAVSQTANLQEWQNSAGTVLASLAYSGAFVAPAGQFNNGVITGYLGEALGTGAYMTITAASHMQLETRLSTNRGLVIKGAVTQSADLFQVRDSGNNVLSEFFNDGSLGVNTHRLIQGSSAASANSFSARISSQAAGVRALLVQLLTAQTGNAFEIRDGSANLITNIDNSGAVTAAGFSTTGVITGGTVKATSNFQIMNRVTTARTGGAASALPANPVAYYQILDQDGNIRYIPGYS
jgi:hypothetical protein